MPDVPSPFTFRARLGRILVLATVSFLLGSPSQARGATMGGDEFSAVLNTIQQTSARLLQTQGELEGRFGFTGSKESVARAIAEAGLSGGTERIPTRLYVLWRALEPFFKRHATLLQAQRDALERQGHVPSHDTPWLYEACSGLIAQSEVLAIGLERALELNLQLLAQGSEVAAASKNLESSRRAVAGIGTLGTKDLITQARNALVQAQAQQGAHRATLLAHEQVLLGDAQVTLTPTYVPASERPLHGLTRVQFTSAELPAGKDEAGTTKALDLGSLSVQAAALAGEIQALTDAYEALIKQAQVHTAKAHETERQLARLTTPADLPEVRTGMAKRGALEARINAQRQAIRAIDTSTPEGYRAAESAAQEVLALQAQLPAVDAELTRLKSKAYMAAWRRGARDEAAKERASALTKKQDASRLRRQMMQKEAEAMRVKSQLLDAALEAQLQDAALFLKGVNGHPGLTSLSVTRPEGSSEGSVLSVAYPNQRSFLRGIARLQTQRAALAQATATLTRTWQALAQAEDRARPLEFPASIGTPAISKVWKASIKRLALKGVRGMAGKALRRAFAAPPEVHIEGQREASKGGAPAGDLALALERFEATLSSTATQKLLRNLTLRELRRAGAEDLTIDSPSVESLKRHLELLARIPFFELAEQSHIDALAAAEAAGASLASLYEGMETSMGGKATRGIPLRVGDPVTLTVEFKGRTRTPCPRARIGTQALPLTSASRGTRCVYRLSRLGALPAGNATLSVGSPP